MAKGGKGGAAREDDKDGAGKTAATSWASRGLVAAALVGVLAVAGREWLWRAAGGAQPSGAVGAGVHDALLAQTKDKAAPLLSVREVRARRQKLSCKNRHPKDADCDNMASRGDCDVAPGWMAVYCAASCDACELLKPEVRCDAARIGYEPRDAWRAGDLDRLFAGLPERFPAYNVSFLSRPPAGPWVAYFHDFLSDQEIDTLVEQTGGDLRRSTDQGAFDADGVQEQVLSQDRTSRNAWCSNECEEHPVVRGVSKRIELITGVPEDNYESFQLLRYEIGQEYKRHHDMSEEDNEQLSGPRILTFFLYLSDVEAGGGTQFTDLKPPLTVTPKKGGAILWPSVHNEDVTKMDARTHHAALPVERGIKLAANHWIHLRNYKTPNLHGCTGSFTEAEVGEEDAEQ
jgi:prolyl 4-hydroxylase